MKLIILHHHLKMGGVTRIIALQIKSLLKIGYKKDDIKILCGYKPKEHDSNGIETIVEPELDYLYRENVDDIILHDHLKKTSKILKKIISKEDIIHIHNYGLGKNPILTIAISQMINNGYKVLNHCHDFAEDRPANMDYLESIIKDHFGLPVADILYPIKRNLIYGVINRSDKERLFESGIPENDIRYLPNPVDISEFSKLSKDKKKQRQQICKVFDIDLSKTIVTYPVRVIRRKNIEELILLSILFIDKVNFIVTLPPENPVEIKYYEYWKNFSIQNNLPIIFDASYKIDFRELLNGSDFCITTSTMEGFGMTFLEPWLTNTPTIGRDLPFVTNDFKKNGLIYTSLYKNIIIRDQDFKDLDAAQKELFLRALIDSTAKKEELLNQNPDIEILFNKISDEIIEKNRELIKENYSLENYGQLLDDIYKNLLR